MATTIREYDARRLLGESVVELNVGCFPWHGQVEISFLTAKERDSDPALQEPGEIAAWSHYNFGAGLASWGTVAALGHLMSAAYYGAAEGDKSATVEAFCRACATAAARPEVAEALGSLSCDPGLRISVDHPDNGRAFYPPSNVVEASPKN
jgi:hypothetical protein